ncbi:hypothetical protein SAMN04490356_2365 [Streptomyces melanosporofaciens]|uniref:Uncharacterized protein n=1 Tax=Streptomyces melanosporofaciens TaxID=67327 RepID=A0A1H4NLV3_STRMJ|nr:hypothetical protein SAMN04490356_2365 [Streptomyces melanosporofaciens]
MTALFGRVDQGVTPLKEERTGPVAPLCAASTAIRGAARPPAGGAADAGPYAGSSPVRATWAYQRALDFGTRACV